MRLFQDPIAKAIFSNIYTDNNKYVTDILSHGVAIGRIDPNFDFAIFADILVGAITMMGIKAFSSANYVVGQLEEEPRIIAMLTKLYMTALTPT